MGPIVQERHRPGNLKQQNKSHKHGRHRSKGALDKIAKGKVAPKSLTKKASRELRREERRNRAAQIRHRKREEVVAQKRAIGSARTAPILVVIIALSNDADPYAALELLKRSDSDATLTTSGEKYAHISIPRLKQRFCFLSPPPGNLCAALDALKVADAVLFLLSAAGEGLDDEGETLLSAAFGQGLPTPVIAASNIMDLPIKRRSEVKQNLQKLVTRWLPDEKLSVLDSQMDAQVLLRRLGGQKRRSVAQRDNRAHLLADVIQFEPGEENGFGTLKVSGYIRGQPLSVNGLVHISGWGDFQLLQMDAPDDPHPLLLGNASRAGTSEAAMEEGCKVLDKADPTLQESLVSENVPDPMDAEQTWPTAEELAEADLARKKKIVKRVPKGMSEYQAAWIPDSDGEQEEMSTDDEDSDEGGVPKAMSEEESCSGASDVDDMESVTVSEMPDSTHYDQEIDLDEEKRALATIKDARLDAMFPDEMDTPQDVPARIRFQKYRGLKSFRTTIWDPREELPFDYGRIFKFANFASTRKKILNNDDRSGALPGWYVTLYIARVPAGLLQARNPAEPLIVVGLLPHEQKMSVIHVVLKRYINGPQIPIKSKQNLIFHIGFRRFQAAPIFSQHTNGNKHKYERFFQMESTVVASFFGPITFPPASALVFLEDKQGNQQLVATGSVLSVDPDRVVVKRTVLSGHPFKVNKRSAVVRFMFFSREDIAWFKPLELRTKYGRRGHIKEPLGTHGHMKCVFDGQLNSQDTVLLHLYKRVFPKWTYNASIPDHKKPLLDISELDS